jgi:hypothetical protein
MSPNKKHWDKQGQGFHTCIFHPLTDANAHSMSFSTPHTCNQGTFSYLFLALALPPLAYSIHDQASD